MDSNNGKGMAIASLILGIFSALFGWFSLLFTASGITGLVISLITIVLGVVCLVLISKARKRGFTGGMKVPCYIFSIMTIVIGGIAFAVSGLFCLTILLRQMSASN